MKNKRIALLWGAGLGDFIVIHPLLKAIKDSGSEVVYLTSANHLPEITSILTNQYNLVQLNKNPCIAIHQSLSCGTFDIAYLGPHPTWKTKILAKFINAKNIYISKPENNTEFIGKTIHRDIDILGFRKIETKRIFLTDSTHHSTPEKPYLILHAGSKARWQTTSWPNSNWNALISYLLKNFLYDIIIIGTTPELNKLRELITPFENTPRVKLLIDCTLGDLEQLICDAIGVIAHNSGIMHLSSFHGIPTIVINGSSAYYWRPDYPWTINIQSNSCRLACNQYKCPVPFYNARCIREIKLDQVISHIESWKAKSII